MKKIAIITPFLARGGLEKVAILGAEELSKFYDVTLIVLDSFIQDYPYEGKMIDIGVSLENRSIIKRTINIFLTGIRLKKIKKKYAFDLIISHGELANIPNIFSGGKVILTVHENKFAALKDIQGKFVNKIIKFAYKTKNIQKIVTVSQGIKDRFIEKYHLKENYIQTFYNPYDIAQITRLAKQNIDDFNTVFASDVLISAARLSEQKGHRYLLQIFKNLLKTNSTVKLVLLGDGELKDELVALSKSLGLKTYSIFSDDVYNDGYDVYFIGFQKNPFKYMAQSKIFVMSSLWEGFGNTIVESMTSNTPVISTDCESGPREILAPDIKTNIEDICYARYGVLMPVFEIKNDRLALSHIDKWVSVLNNLLQNQQILNDYKQLGAKRVMDFDIQNIIKQWKDLIDSVLGE